MTASMCEVCGLIAGGATDTRNARKCVECAGRHSVCAACVSRFDLGDPKAGKRVQECPDGARLMAELMGEDTGPRERKSKEDWERLLKASDAMNGSFNQLVSTMAAAGSAMTELSKAMSVTTPQAASVIQNVMAELRKYSADPESKTR